MYCRIILIIIIFISSSCKNRNEKELRKVNKNTINRDINKIVENNNNLIDTTKVSFDANCDSLIFIPKTGVFPNILISEAIKKRSLNLLKKEIDTTKFLLGSEYSDIDEYFSEWKANEKESTFWEYLEKYIKMEGMFLSDSIYVTPKISFIDTQNCDLEYKLLILENTNIYEKPNYDSVILKKVNRNKVVQYDNSKTIIPLKKYETMRYPQVEEFDKDIWFFIPDYEGYINNSNVWNMYYSTSFYFELNVKSKKWLLTEMVSFD
ncbi:MAG: hypothetical protein ACK5M1_04570 [Xanthomarina gelatinilytica]|uniref:hypothetical protein n=1 Tax=Xanthomarina gelatinilytica TaxID=1137281 RepID=UPI003A892CC9